MPDLVKSILLLIFGAPPAKETPRVLAFPKATGVLSVVECGECGREVHRCCNCCDRMTCDLLYWIEECTCGVVTNFDGSYLCSSCRSNQN